MSTIVNPPTSLIFEYKTADQDGIYYRTLKATMRIIGCHFIVLSRPSHLNYVIVSGMYPSLGKAQEALQTLQDEKVISEIYDINDD